MIVIFRPHCPECGVSMETSWDPPPGVLLQRYIETCQCKARLKIILWRPKVSDLGGLIEITILKGEHGSVEEAYREAHGEGRDEGIAADRGGGGEAEDLRLDDPIVDTPGAPQGA